MHCLFLAAALGMGMAAAKEPPMFPGDFLTAPTGEQFEAVVHIDATPGAKRFQGVWLQRDDGQRLLVDYRPRSHWQPFEGVRVSVSGEAYMPEGQSIGADHFRVHTLAVIDPKPEHSITQMGPERTLTGRFTFVPGAPGSKMEGSGSTFFDTGGMNFLLANFDKAFRGAGTVEARQVSLSPFSAHVMGPRIWVLSFEPSPDPEKKSPPGE